MQVFNVEVFDRSMNCIFHDEIDSANFNYTEDYISYTGNSVEVRVDNAPREGNLISIHNAEEQYIGLVKSTEKTNKDTMEITYNPFYSLFDADVLFDTNLQGGSDSLEVVLKNYIEAYFVNNSDALQNCPAIGNFTLLSSTTNWDFNINSDNDNSHYAVIGLYGILMIRAFNKYGIAIRCIPNFSTRTIDIEIGKSQEPMITIETGLRNVLACEIMMGKLDAGINKLIVYDQTDYTNTKTYYLHTDGSYDTTDADRVLPVVYDIISVEPTQDKTFDDLADSGAADVFSGTKYNNCISITTLKNDSRIYPMSLKLGQEVRIIHNGASYYSIYSKREIKGTIKLTFGSVRLELTKLLKGAYFNGKRN